MSDARLPASPLQPLRERTIVELSQHFAVDHISAEELESRLDRAIRATAPEELRSLVADLPAVRPAAGQAPVASSAAPGVELARPEEVEESGVVVAVMGGGMRKGHWTPPRQLTVIAVMGGAELDFREARMAPGVTEVNVLAFMGGAEIVVPPGVHVQVNGVAIMGGFDHRGNVAPPPGANVPVLRIGGFAFMGGVEVSVRNAGETSGDARRRLRAERKEQKRLSRGG